MAICNAFREPHHIDPHQLTMPRKLSSKLAETNARINAAIAALQDKKFKSAYAAAKHFKIDCSTLTCRLNGGATHAQSRESTQLLSKAEEEALVLWIKRLTAGGYPASHRIVREMVWEILTHRVAKINTTDMQLVNIPPIGKEWVKRFARRYPNLGTVRSRTMDFARWKDATPEAINDWFDAFESTVATYQISDSNIYNMDETGFAIGSSQSN